MTAALPKPDKPTKPLKPIEQLVIDTGVRLLDDHGEVAFADIEKELGKFRIGKQTLRHHFELRVGTQLIPVRERWFNRSKRQQMKAYNDYFDPEDKFDAGQFVASGTEARGYCRPSHVTEAMRWYVYRNKNGKMEGAVGSRQRLIDSYDCEGVPVDPPAPPVQLPPSTTS